MEPMLNNAMNGATVAEHCAKLAPPMKVYLCWWTNKGELQSREPRVLKTYPHETANHEWVVTFEGCTGAFRVEHVEIPE